MIFCQLSIVGYHLVWGHISARMTRVSRGVSPLLGGRGDIVLKGKNVVVGVCGGIAVYKVVDVVSRLKKLGADVDVIMTENATRFVSPITFRSISHNPVACDMFEEPKSWDIRHISLAEKADIILVAPATANIIGKLANGIADDMLSTTVMAAKAPVLIVPAMNTNMFENPVVQNNLTRLESLGYHIMEPGTGLMACGTSGKGRLPEPEEIVREVQDRLAAGKDLDSCRILITAGPTREPVDPVRFISNHSSGKMGYSIAEAAVQRGADVMLVSGPVSLSKPKASKMVKVETAEEMLDAVMKNQEDYDIFIMVAAVADYRCVSVAGEKIKKKEDKLTLELTKNPDIAKELGKIKGNRLLVGFSAETGDLEENAKGKLAAKNLDMIVANDVTQEGAGFGTDTNIVRMFFKDGTSRQLPIMSKKSVANEILDEIKRIRAKQ